MNKPTQRRRVTDTEAGGGGRGRERRTDGAEGGEAEKDTPTFLSLDRGSPKQACLLLGKLAGHLPAT